MSGSRGRSKMNLGIVGLSNAGKSTVFNALTGAGARIDSFSGGSDEANVAVVKIPDPRLDYFHEYFTSKKKTHVELKVTDFAPLQKGQGEKGFPARYIGELRACDALLLVVRAFEDDAVPHPDGEVNPSGDLEALLLELAMADLEVIERRLTRIEESRNRSSKEERKKLDKEKGFLESLRDDLEQNGAVTARPDDAELELLIRNYGFLTMKPLLCALNIHEDHIGADVPEDVQKVADGASLPLAALAGGIEMEIAGLEPEEREAFLEDLGIEEPARDRILRMAWESMGLIVFFTVGEDECRAWPVRRGDNAVTAAGKVHTDMARGFIRAEVVACEDFRSLGGAKAARDAGKYRLEGRDYIVKDGDVIEFRFNV